MFRRSSLHKHGRDELLDIESILQSSLKPVSPRPEFIVNLQKGLMDYSFPSIEETNMEIKRALLFAIFGLSGFVLVFSLWIRLIIVVISALGMIQTSKPRRISK